MTATANTVASSAASLSASLDTPTSKAVMTETPLSAKHEPYLVGLQFVQEYYTFMSRDPHKLHCFYNKHSLMLHGVEGDRHEKVCRGQQEIHDRILALGLEDCKVLVSNVDCQASINNGIVVVVTGELSNRGEPLRRFSQTFFLAEQPSGYYVLNDIFRYLLEQEPVNEVEAVVESVKIENEEPVVESVTEETVVLVDEKITETVVEEKVVELLPESESAVVEEKVVVTVKETVVETVSVTSAKPKSWAHMAAGETHKWGNEKAAAVGTTVVSAAAVKDQQQQQQRHHQNRQGASAQQRRFDQRQEHAPVAPYHQRDHSQDHMFCVFLKNVNEPVTANDLKAVLSQFGTIKYVDHNVMKGVATVEFATQEQARAAMGHAFEVGGVKLLVEEKRVKHYQNAHSSQQQQQKRFGRQGSFKQHQQQEEKGQQQHQQRRPRFSNNKQQQRAAFSASPAQPETPVSTPLQQQ